MPICVIKRHFPSPAGEHYIDSTSDAIMNS